jgi:hypothetical protein
LLDSGQQPVLSELAQGQPLEGLAVVAVDRQPRAVRGTVSDRARSRSSVTVRAPCCALVPDGASDPNAEVAVGIVRVGGDPRVHGENG